MEYTIEEIREIGRRQLTATEIMLIKMRVVFNESEIADLLQESRQSINVKFKTIKRKLEEQGL